MLGVLLLIRFLSKQPSGEWECDSRSRQEQGTPFCDTSASNLDCFACDFNEHLGDRFGQCCWKLNPLSCRVNCHNLNVWCFFMVLLGARCVVLIPQWSPFGRRSLGCQVLDDNVFQLKVLLWSLR